MKISYILPLLAVAAFGTGCSKEDPFGPFKEGEGSFLKSSLSMDIDADGLVNTRGLSRAAVDANVDDFTVIFTREGNSQPIAKYRYGDMPEVVALQAGTYTCTATYGENRQAEWESPYFLGVSQTFEVVPNEIVSYVEPIQCRLENIKVTVDFDAELRAHMSTDSYAEVKVGSSAALRYGLEEANSQKGGFFMHQDEITLVAVFNGKVDGVETVETKSLKNIEKGNHYKITFKLHPGASGDGSGDVNADVTVDASVTVVDVTKDIPIGDDVILDDNERPNNGGGDEPPGPVQNPPTIVGLGDVNLDAVNDIDTLGEIKLKITSTAEGGFTGFTCDIVSEKLSPEELNGAGLSDHLDLVNPGELAEALENLGLPVNVGGMKTIEFDLTSFKMMLKLLTPGQSDFVLTVTDANGTTTKTLKLKF